MGRELRSLIERQNGLQSELSTLLDGAEDVLTEEQERRCKELKDSIVSLGSQIEYRFLADESARVQAGEAKQPEFRHFSVSRAIRSMLDGGRTDAGYEREISRELEMRGQKRRHENSILIPREELRAVSSTNTGAKLIASDLRADQYIDSVWEATPFSRLPVRRLSGLTGNVVLPKSSTVTSCGWFQDGGQIPSTDKTFSTISLQPHWVGAIATVSLGMVRQASTDIDALLMADFSKALGLAEAKAILNGTGADGQPKGMLHASNGIASISADAEPLKWAAAAMAALFQNHIENVGFLVNSAKFNDCEGQLTTDKAPISAATFFHGRPYAYFSEVPAADTLVAGDFSELLVASWGSPELVVNPWSEFSTGAVQVRIIDGVDVAVRHSEAFVTLGGE